MRTRADATSFCPPVVPLNAGYLRGRSIRHTIRPDGTRDWLLICTLEGSGLYRCGETEYRSHANVTTLFRPGASQDYQCSPDAEKWDLLYAHFLPRPEWPSWMLWPERVPGLMALELKDPATRRRILHRLHDMTGLNRSSHARREELGLNALEEALLWCDSLNPRRHDSALDPRIRKAMDFLIDHLAEPFSEEALARAAGLSGSRLRHLFREQTGDSPRNFQELRRMTRAKELLTLSRLTIAEIAEEIGFDNQFYFTLRFKKHLGESPTSYRRRQAP